MCDDREYWVIMWRFNRVKNIDVIVNNYGYLSSAQLVFVGFMITFLVTNFFFYLLIFVGLILYLDNFIISHSTFRHEY